VDVIRTLYNESPQAWRRTLFVAGVAGLANASILAIINRGAAIASGESGLSGLRLVLLFGLSMLAFYLGKRYALIQASVIVEHMVRSRLVRVMDKIRKSELEVVEGLGRGEIYTKMAQDTSLVSHSGLILVNAAQQTFVLAFCLFYIAWLSRPAFIATVVTIAAGMAIYFRHARSLGPLLAGLTQRQGEQIDTISHIIDGFKEVRLNARKSDAVFERFATVTREVRDLKIAAQIRFCVDIMFSDLFFYTLLSVVVFLLPALVPTSAAVVLMTTAAILFIIGPLQMVVQAAPVFQRATAALANIQGLEARLDALLGAETPANAKSYRDFSEILLDHGTFTYQGSGSGERTGFTAGPVNLRIARGETVFIVGGNGSGKTTTLKMLTGLYLPQRGALRVDSELIDQGNVQAYRELFATVFSDFHLFDRLYGLEQVEERQVSKMLDDMELASKTRFENGRFTVLNLSTGQRKRLALAVCLLEDRDVLVFDEWAADQDPHFRRHFYEDVLRDLKARGKTIIAATHDDRYWHVADRVVRLEYGAMVDAQLAH
jgi:putative pyoverdin transport system ATP-binding/permease protein